MKNYKVLKIIGTNYQGSYNLERAACRAVIIEDNSSIVEELFHGKMDSDEVELPSLTIQSSDTVMLTSSNPNLLKPKSFTISITLYPRYHSAPSQNIS